MQLDRLLSPVSFLHDRLGDEAQPLLPTLRDYETWWEAHGKAISEAVDRTGTPWVKMYDAFGSRIDQLLYSPDYRTMLNTGYRYGVVWRAFEESLTSAYLLGYVTSFFDMGLYCPYTVSLATAVAVDKYAPESVREDHLRRLLVKDDTVWQGATWMTEARGGSDLGAAVETIARPAAHGCWLLTGDKYFCSNAGAELAVVAARPDSAPQGVRGLALFLVPRYRGDGSLNYHLRRLKDKVATRSVPTGEVELRESEAYLLGTPEIGIYLILEVLNISRVCNAVGSIALAQRAIAEAYQFASHRVVFGRPLIDQPLMARQFAQKLEQLQQGFAMAWECVQLLSAIWRETAPHYSEMFHLFRIITHLAKYWTAEIAVQTAKWSMEVHGGIGTLAEFGVERLLREAMIADIWEGPPHRQILDGLEAMERKGAHRLLFAHLAPHAEPDVLTELQRRVEAHLALPQDEKEAGAEDLFSALAAFTARALAIKRQPALAAGNPT